MQTGKTKNSLLPLLTENGLLPEEELAILEAVQEAKQGRGVSRSMTLEEIFKELDA